jgi:dephospho-CoA kinase
MPGWRAVAPVSRRFRTWSVEDGGGSTPLAQRHWDATTRPSRRLEAIVHPLVTGTGSKPDLAIRPRREGVRLAVLDIPLLFETGLDAEGRQGGGGFGPARHPAGCGFLPAPA